jgi:hypothetical protein
MQEFFEVLDRHLDEVFDTYLGKMLEATTQDEAQEILNEFIEKYEPNKETKGVNEK